MLNEEMFTHRFIFNHINNHEIQFFVNQFNFRNENERNREFRMNNKSTHLKLISYLFNNHRQKQHDYEMIIDFEFPRKYISENI